MKKTTTTHSASLQLAKAKRDLRKARIACYDPKATRKELETAYAARDEAQRRIDQWELALAILKVKDATL